MQDYSLPQIETFLTAIDGEERAANRDAVIAARAATVKPDDFKRLMKDLC